MTGKTRLAVIGLGAAGLAAAMAAARDGFDVTGFEQSDLDNQPASSGGRGKIIRFGYDDPFYADLMKATLPRWTALAEATGRRLMDVHGGIHVGTVPEMAIVAGGIEAAGHPYEMVHAGSTVLHDHGLRVRDGEPGVYEPTAGVMWTSQVRAALAEQAVAAGAVLRDHTTVDDMRVTASGVRLRTPDGSSDFDRVILSGGPWSFRLVPHLASRFVITRRFQLVYSTDGPIGNGRPHPWIDHTGTGAFGTGYYGMTNVADGLHLVGLHQIDGEQSVRDPGEPDDEAIRTAVIDEAVEYAMERFGLPGPPGVADIRACHYTSTVTRDFVIDDCPGLPGVTLLSPCSGHGFKFAITSGEYAATHAAGRSIPDGERFRLDSATKT